MSLVELVQFVDSHELLNIQRVLFLTTGKHSLYCPQRKFVLATRYRVSLDVIEINTACKVTIFVIRYQLIVNLIAFLSMLGVYHRPGGHTLALDRRIGSTFDQPFAFDTSLLSLIAVMGGGLLLVSSVIDNQNWSRSKIVHIVSLLLLHMVFNVQSGTFKTFFMLC